MPELHLTGLLAQLQNLLEQAAKRLQVKLAEIRDGAEMRCVERHDFAGKCNQPKCLILLGTAGWTRTTDLLIHSQAL